MITKITKPKDIVRVWHVIDLKNQVLGRAATTIASKLMGKHKTIFTPSLDCGDYVVAVNAAKVKFTGNKMSGKIYRHHTGFPGGFREKPLSEVFAKNPAKVIQKAVNGMLPKNKLRALRLKRLKIFLDENHPYTSKVTPPTDK